jgi:hypothetical protein
MVASLLLGIALVQGQARPTKVALADSALVPPAAVSMAGVALAVLARPEAPRIDGRLDDAAWRAAPVLDGFLQREPAEGAPATERTEARVVFTDDALFIAIRAWDSRADLISAQLSRRDEFTPSDWVGVMIDSYQDRRTAFEFAVNPLGVKRDVYLFNDSEADVSWNAVWEVATTQDAEGWSAEFRIPFSQLRFSGSGQDQIGLNVYRLLNRANEEQHWKLIPRESEGWVSQFGDLAGLAAVEPKRHLEILPYVLAQQDVFPAASNPFTSGSHSSGTIGGDIRAGLTPTFNLTATINPDFGQVEADPAVVNLTAFETFFPEQRPFFTEGVDLFRFPISRGSQEQLFYSRRIGRAPQGRADARGGYADQVLGTRIIGAGKVTGKTRGGWSSALLAALTAEENATVIDSTGVRHRDVVEPRTGYFVGRIGKEYRGGQTVLSAFGTGVARRITEPVNFLRSSAFTGGLNVINRFRDDTHRLRASVALSHVAGSAEAIDATQRSSVHYFQRPDAGYVAYDPTRTSLGGLSASAEVSKYSGGAWLWSLSAETRTPGFETNDLGFQRWAGQSWAEGSVSHRWLRPGPLARRADVRTRLVSGWTYDGERINTAWNVGTSLQFNNYWNLDVSVWNRTGGLRTDALRGGPALTMPANTFAFLGLTTDGRNAFRVGINTSVNRFHEGSRWYSRVGTELRWRLGSRQEFIIAPQLEWETSDFQYLATEDVNGTTEYFLGDVDRKTTSLTFRGNFTFSPTLSVQLYGEPFISNASYRSYKRAVAPRADPFVDQFEVFTDDQVFTDAGGNVSIDVDGNGQPDVDLGNPNFTALSFRSNAVLRWEYRPGSTLFLVWQHNRAETLPSGDVDLGSSTRTLVNASGGNTFLVKLSYWLNLR